MRKWILATMAVSATLCVFAFSLLQDKHIAPPTVVDEDTGQKRPAAFDLEDPAQVRQAMEDFAATLADRNHGGEMWFREDTIRWYYKSSDVLPALVPPDSSLARVGFLAQLMLADTLGIDLENRLIMRTFYQDTFYRAPKHRYAFHINQNGLIDGIIYVPPLTYEFFPEKGPEDFAWLDEQINGQIDSVQTMVDQYGSTDEFSIALCILVLPAVNKWVEQDSVIRQDPFVPYHSLAKPEVYSEVSLANKMIP